MAAGNRGSGFAQTRNEGDGGGGVVDPDELAKSLAREYNNHVREISRLSQQPDAWFDAEGNPTERGIRIAQLNDAADQADLRLQALGYDVMGLPLGADDDEIGRGISAQAANAAADRASREGIAALERDSAERINRERIASDELRTKQTLESGEKVSGEDREQRRQGEFLSSLNDILDAEIERGNLSVREAEQRRQAAYQQAEINADLTKHFAGYALPAGAAYYPGLEPGGILSGLLGGFSMPTMGTQPINPNTFSDPITAALAGMNGVGIADQAIGNAQAGQQQLGMPTMPQGNTPRVTAPQIDPVAQLLATGG